MTSGVYVTQITPKTFFSGGLYGVNVTICTVVGAKLGSVILSINYTLSAPKIGLYEDVSFVFFDTILSKKSTRAINVIV